MGIAEPTVSTASEETVVRSLYDRMMDGWNQGGGAAFAAPFDEECDFIAFDDTRFRGREEIARFHEPLFKTHLKGMSLVGRVTDVRFLAPHIALMHAEGDTIMRGKSQPAPERRSIQTLVAVKRSGEWRLVAFQSMRVRPIGRNLAGSLLWLASDWLWKW